MKNTVLHRRDFLQLGIFTAIYFGILYLIGFVTRLSVMSSTAYAFVTALVSAPLFLYLMTKISKTWVAFIFFIVPGIVFSLLGESFVVFFHSLIFATGAEYYHRRMGMSSERGKEIAYMIGSLSAVGAFWQIFIIRGRYLEMLTESMGEAYATKMMGIPIWVLLILYLTCLLGAYLGVLISKKILKKEFEKSQFTK